MALSLLAGKVVLVTGGGAGIGQATSQSLADHGASVAVCDIDEAAARSTLEQLTEGEHRLYRGDMSDSADVDRVIGEVIRDAGSLDGVHNNVGVANVPAEIDAITEAEWDRVVGINLRGAWLVMRRALIQMQTQKAGAIVNTASIAGTHGFRQLAPYCVSKAGVIALTRVAAIENAESGIRINAVAPGMVNTGIGVEDLDNRPNSGPEPSRRYGAPQEVAEAVCWLLSEHASYVNGVSLAVDGGWSATAAPRRSRNA
jgi:NAD(P)-dependent dehydrogenase (short-subunit alcohol dehydrogenase family)